jgi:hypothetical protein
MDTLAVRVVLLYRGFLFVPRAKASKHCGTAGGVHRGQCHLFGVRIYAQRSASIPRHRRIIAHGHYQGETGLITHDSYFLPPQPMNVFVCRVGCVLDW